MSRALVTTQPRPIQVSTPQEVERMSVTLSKSTLVPRDFRGKPANIFLAISLGAELGLSPIASLRSIHVIEGTPSLSSEAMLAIVRASGVCDYFRCVESTPNRATYEAKRIGETEPVRKTFTLDDAKAAGLTGKANWKKHQRQMLEARAKAWLCRDLFGDVVHGLYTPEELNAREELAIDAEVGELHEVDPETGEYLVEDDAILDVDDAKAAILGAATPGELVGIGKRFPAFEGPERAEVVDAYRRQMAILKGEDLPQWLGGTAAPQMETRDVAEEPPEQETPSEDD